MTGHSPIADWDPVAFEAQIERDLPRNYTAHLLHGMLGMTGFRLVFAPTFVPASLSKRKV